MFITHMQKQAGCGVCVCVTQELWFRLLLLLLLLVVVSALIFLPVKLLIGHSALDKEKV